MDRPSDSRSSVSGGTKLEDRGRVVLCGWTDPSLWANRPRDTRYSPVELSWETEVEQL